MSDEHFDKPSKSSQVISAALLIAGVVILAYTSWFIYHSLTLAQDSYTQTAAVNNSNRLSIGPENLAKTYTDGLSLVSVKYPASWKLATSLDQSEPGYPLVRTTITSPRGTILHLNLDWGGRGGACFPNPTDKPFQAGNACSSVERLSVQPSGITNVYDYISHVTTTSSGQTFEKSNIVLTTKHYADEPGHQKYVIGLVMSNGSYPVVTNKPVMGYVTEDDWFSVLSSDKKWHGELHAYASFDKAAALNSQDALTVKAILKSMTINLGS